jgi:hypothetical protein
MRTIRSLLKGAPALGAVLLLSAPVPAQLQTCSTDAVPLTPTNWTQSLTFDRFDPNLGVLLSIEFSLSAQAEGSIGVESLDQAPSTAVTEFQATVELRRPGGTAILVAQPGETFTDDLATFDGVVDFMGPSGETHGPLAVDETTAGTSTDPADFALFTGPAGNPGSIDLPAEALGTSSATGPGNVLLQYQTSAAVDVEVCYIYGLDCNGNGIPDSTDISNGTSNDITPDGIPDECQPDTTSVCEGDGPTNGGADCPCGNNGNPGEGCANGSGTGIALTASGTPSVSNDTLSLTVTGLQPTTPGQFFVGLTLAGGGDGVPFGHGLRCIDTPVLVAKATGGGTIPLPGSPPLSVLLNAVPGLTHYFQYWYRDTNGPCPGVIGVNTTNAIQVTWGL